ncbi:MAG: hypothetical protein IJ287_07230, partial [Methanobrevibacter sp.]|nr:hypothetical protein [Methanobrevibacter sp.]
AVIAGNDIVANGNTYIYAIILSGDDFVIRGNNISSTGVYYADGIDIEGPATGVVEENNINVKAETSAYGIYSGMNGQNASANYTGNNITGNAYNVFGFSLGDVESNVVKNYINLDGNYTTGLAARTGVLNVTENRIVLISSEEGNESVWEGFGVAARGIFAMTGNVTIDNNIIATSGTGVFLTGVDDADVKNNFINVVANTDKDAYGIYAGVLGGLSVLDNNIDYEGATQGTGINNALFIAGTDGALVFDNNFTVDLVSVPVAWAEEPAGSGNWVSSPVSEGIVVKYSNGVIFDNNKVNVTYGDVVGAYDTIYAVDFVESNDSIITNNHIVAKGYTYIYGIILSGDNFIIRANNIDSTGDYYANGIDIEGPATGVVEDNVIDVAANTSAYAIYSGMNGQDVKANYTGNKITGDAYNVFGFSLGDVESNIDANVVMLDGNYTTGIAYRGDVITVTNNTIYAIGSNEGDESVWEAFGVESIGVKVVKGNATIANNTYIVTTGDYPINVQDNVAVVNDNYLVGKRFIGDEGVANAGNSEVYNNTPEIGNKTSSTISVTGVDGDCNVTGVLVYEDGEPISNVDVQYTINGVSGVVKTDANGTFIIAGIDNGKLDIIFGGDSYTNSSNTTITLKDIAPVKQATAVNVTVGEITDKNTNVTVDIPGATGNVSVIIDGIETVVPLVNGSAVVPVENITVGEHDVVVVYLGDDNHAAAYNVSSIFLEGFATEFANITVNGGGLIDAALVNSLGSPMVNATVTYKVDGVEYNTTTDDLGKFYINITGKSVVEMYYAGDDYFSPSNVTIKLENIAPAKETSVLVSSDYTQYACDFYADERGGNFTFQLVDEMGNPLANKTVYIGYNGVTLNGTTDANGKAAVQINLMNAGLYTFVIVFLGDEDYNATMAVHKVTINKKTTSIAASAKTFKATAKTKKYTVTLKTIKGASVDGKTYLKAGKKVTMKINGKTYTGKTNAKGQVTFSIKLTKKGKFAAKISYAGDVTYKASSASVKITIK